MDGWMHVCMYVRWMKRVKNGQKGRMRGRELMRKCGYYCVHLHSHNRALNQSRKRLEKLTSHVLLNLTLLMAKFVQMECDVSKNIDVIHLRIYQTTILTL